MAEKKKEIKEAKKEIKEPEKKEIKVTAKQLVDTYKMDQRKAEEMQRKEITLREMLNEMLVATEAVKEIQKTSKDEPIMVSLGAGIYAEAKISNVKTVKKSLGGNILVESDTEKVLLKLQKEIEGTQKQLAGLRSEISKTMQNLQGISALLQQGQRAMQEKSGSELSSVS